MWLRLCLMSITLCTSCQQQTNSIVTNAIAKWCDSTTSSSAFIFLMLITLYPFLSLHQTPRNTQKMCLLHLYKDQRPSLSVDCRSTQAVTLIKLKPQDTSQDEPSQGGPRFQPKENHLAPCSLSSTNILSILSTPGGDGVTEQLYCVRSLLDHTDYYLQCTYSYLDYTLLCSFALCDMFNSCLALHIAQEYVVWEPSLSFFVYKYSHMLYCSSCSLKLIISLVVT